MIFGWDFIYQDIRIGKLGKKFICLKFRTMKLSNFDEERLTTSINDERIIKYGKFIRKHRIDEFPQLLNVLNGSLSLVGPRPERERLSNFYMTKIRNYENRLQITPGLTGLSQTTIGYVSDVKGTSEKTKLDIWYSKNKSHRLDALILIKTILIVLTGKGSR